MGACGRDAFSCLLRGLCSSARVLWEHTRLCMHAQVDLLGKSLVVWADSKGAWHCFEDVCPHRLAPLSEGRVEGDSLMCSYHG